MFAIILAALKGMFLNFVCTTVLSDLMKSEGKINWAAVQASVNASIQKIPFGSFIDTELCAFVDVWLTDISVLLNGPLQATLLADLVAGNFSAALSALIAALAGSALPSAPAAVTLQALKK